MAAGQKVKKKRVETVSTVYLRCIYGVSAGCLRRDYGETGSYGAGAAGECVN